MIIRQLSLVLHSYQMFGEPPKFQGKLVALGNLFTAPFNLAVFRLTIKPRIGFQKRLALRLYRKGFDYSFAHGMKYGVV